MMSPKPTSGESARFHLSDYRLVAGITSGLPVIRPLTCASDGSQISVSWPELIFSNSNLGVEHARHPKRNRGPRHR